MNILHEKRKALGYMARGGDGGGEGGDGSSATAGQYGGKPGESNMANAAAGLGPAAPSSTSASAPDMANVEAAVNAALSAGKPGESNMANAAAGLASSSAAPASVADTSGLSTRGISLSSPVAAPAVAGPVGKPGEEAQATAQALSNSKGKSAADFANALADMMPGVDPMDAMMAGLGGITKGDQTEVNSSGIMGSLNDTTGMLSTNGLTAGQIASLVDLGYGAYGINNPEINQTPQMMLNSMHTGAFLNGVVAPLAMGLIPGLGIVKGIAGLINAINNDDTPAIASAIGNFGLQAVAKGIGVPAGILGALVEGDLGKAAGSAVTGAALSGIGRGTGIPGSIVGAVGNATGATNAIGSNVAGAVNSVTGGLANTGTGISASNPFGTSNVANAGNGVSNVSNGGGNTNAATSTPSSPASTASTPATSTSTTSSPAASSAYSGLSAVPVTNGPNAADIGYYYDIAGNTIFAPKKAGTEKPDIIEYLQNNVATAAQGGSIDDLLNYVRK